MDRITKAINLLDAVLATMDQIAVVGVENQSRFVGCAEAVQNVSQTLMNFVNDVQTQSAETEEGNGG
jgi:hypothetical protein